MGRSTQTEIQEEVQLVKMLTSLQLNHLNNSPRFVAQIMVDTKTDLSRSKYIILLAAFIVVFIVIQVDTQT